MEPIKMYQANITTNILEDNSMYRYQKYSWSTIAIVVFIAYLSLVRALRYRRLNRLIRNVERDCGKITTSKELPLYHAEAIVTVLSQYEFPRMMALSIQIGIFYTYGIPTISGLLLATSEFTKRSTSHRRWVDTSVLILEGMNSPLDSKRSQLAIQRINWIHKRYGNKISNDDLLYTLSLLFRQQAYFIDEYEWRKCHPIEKMALHKFWSEYGVRMGITGIPDSYEALCEWSEEYEKQYMVQQECNTIVAQATIDILLGHVPVFIRPTVNQFVLAVMSDRVRASFGWARPSPTIFRILDFALALRKFVVKHLMLPRFFPLRTVGSKAIDESVPFEERRYWYTGWESDPWYMQKTVWNTYGPIAWICWAMGWTGPQHNTFKNKVGYRIGEVGPVKLEGKGVGNLSYSHEQAKADGIYHGSTGGCPFKF